jgi:hypothetical protein
MRMITRGETANVAPKEQTAIDLSRVNLSGKSTLVGRTSGESFYLEATKGESRLFGKLSGARTETFF